MGLKGESEPAVEGVVEELSSATHEQPVALGRYDVVGRLGSGGMSTVYEAVDRERGTMVALKTLSAVDAAAGVSLKHEFRVVADLAHPNLAPVYELSHDRGVWFFTMEHIEGVSLTQWTRGDAEQSDQRLQGQLPLSRTLSTLVAATDPNLDGCALGEWAKSGNLNDEDTVVEDGMGLGSKPQQDRSPALPVRDMDAIRRAFAQITLAIEALHDAGLRHGDIKPANVLVRPDGQVVLVDFGLARPLNDALRPLESGGTPTYMAPEQLTGSPVGPEADWYALGATLYGVLTGLRPFVAQTKLELFFKKMYYPPPPPRALLPEVPDDLSELCVALLSPDAALRPGKDELLKVFSGDSVPEAKSERGKGPLFIGRDRELCALEQAYGSAREGRLTVAHLHGPSGIGKSALLKSFLSAVQDVDSALILRGRCYERERVPYKGFDRIIDDLAAHLMRIDKNEATAILPTYTGALAKVFPALASVEAIADRASEEVLTEGAIELRRRAWVALGHLLSAIGKQHPIVLTIDDLQWSDTDSALLLVELLSAARETPLLVVILYRGEEASENEALNPYFLSCKRLEAEGHFLDLPVGALTPPDAERLARATLGAASTDENVRYIAREARGVPIFIEEMGHYVNKQGRETAGVGCQISLDDAIRARVVDLGHEQRALLEVVAVANSPLPQSIVFEAAGLDPGELSALLALRQAAFVNWRGAGADDVVSPYHDRIRESVVAALSADSQEKHHLSLARALAKQRTTHNSWLFDAVRHFAAAESLVSDADERRAAARLHAEAGEVAREAAAYPLAFSCFEGGIRLLGDNAWEDHYDLSLRLHTGAVEAAYLSGERATLEERSAQVKAHAGSVMDQLIAWETEIDACAGRQEYEAALTAGISVLRMLGVELPRNPAPSDVQAMVEPTLARLTELGTDGLSALSELDDLRIAAVTRIQVRLSPVAYFGRPLLLPIIACNLIDTSIERGLSTATPYALALFGIVLNTLEQFEISHEWGMLALQLLERWPRDRRLEAATRHILYNLVCNWMVPLSSMLDPLRKVFDIGRQTGDYEYAGFAAHGYVHNSIYAGRPLGPLKKEALWLGQQLKEFGVNALHVHRPFEQLLKAFTGDLTDPCSLDDEGFDTQAILSQAEADEVRSGALLCVIHLTSGLARYHFGDPAHASESLEQARSHLGGAPSVWHPPTVHLYAALAAGAASRQTTDPTLKPLYRARVEQSVEPLRRLARLAPINFAHRVSLVEAELARLDGDQNGALSKLQQAIREAQEGSWINDVALANELAAECQPTEEARERSLRAARTAYAAWGATTKAARLGERLQALRA